MAISLIKPLTKKLFSPRQEALPGIGASKEIPAKDWSAFSTDKRKGKENKKNGRWAIVILFCLTALASLFFYLKTEAPLLWGKISLPAVISTLPTGAVFNPSPVLTEVENLTKGLRGEYGFFVYRFGDGNQYGIKANQIFTAASLMKLPVMLATYQEVEAGRLKLETYQDSLKAMGKRSDNGAFNKMVKVLGQQKIQTTIDGLGMRNTSFVKNDITPADTGLFFQKLYGGNIISNEHRDEFLSFLTDTSNEERIPVGIPEEIRVAHKIGTELGAYSDAGIVFSQKPFVLVIMSDAARESEAKLVLPQIAKAVWEFENSR